MIYLTLNVDLIFKKTLYIQVLFKPLQTLLGFGTLCILLLLFEIQLTLLTLMTIRMGVTIIYFMGKQDGISKL